MGGSAVTHLTAGEELLIDLLVARRRLGEYEWPISSRSTRLTHSLMAKGLVNSRHGNVEKTYLVRLTDKAIAGYIDSLGIATVGDIIRKKFGRTK